MAVISTETGGTHNGCGPLFSYLVVMVSHLVCVSFRHLSRDAPRLLQNTKEENKNHEDTDELDSREHSPDRITPENVKPEHVERVHHCPANFFPE